MNCSHNYSGFAKSVNEIKASSDIEQKAENQGECLDDVALQELINIPSPLFIGKPDFTE